MNVDQADPVIAEAATPATVEGDFPLEYLYTVGVAGERVLRELRDHGRLLGTRCSACQVTYAPARIYCERCLAELNEWVEVPLAGTLASFTVVYRDVDNRPLARPAILGLIELDGASGGFIHWISGVKAEALTVGQRVRGELRPRAERRGSITDIAFFRPAD
jgi:uncharacterized OB-fold protein